MLNDKARRLNTQYVRIILYNIRWILIILPTVLFSSLIKIKITPSNVGQVGIQPEYSRSIQSPSAVANNEIDIHNEVEINEEFDNTINSSKKVTQENILFYTKSTVSFTLAETHPYLSETSEFLIYNGFNISKGQNIGGFYNTGTNWANYMIELNCENPLITDAFWKHKFWYPQLWHKFPKVPYLFLVKHPLTFAKSICREVAKRGSLQNLYPARFYEKREEYARVILEFDCERDIWEPWVLAPGMQEDTFENLVEVWNEYYAVLLHAITHSDRNMMLVRYEDLLQVDEAMMDTICSHMQSKRKAGKLQIYMKKGKHWSSSNFSNSIRYLDPNYVAWSEKHMARFRKALNPELLHIFGYEF